MLLYRIDYPTEIVTGNIMTQSLINAVNEHLETINSVQFLSEDIEAATGLIKQALLGTNKVMVCGNGGSASDAQHFASELTGRFEKDRQGYAAFSLTTDTAALTAIGNDYGFNRIFARQVESVGHAEDVLMVISTSGNSENLIEAVRQAKQQNIKVIALTGRDGGSLKEMADVSIVVPGKRTSRIQEAHIFILHYICEAFEPFRN